METNDNNKKSTTEIVKEIKRRTKRKFTAEEKINIVLEGLRGEESIAESVASMAFMPITTLSGAKILLKQGSED